jgi:hypothetical protein
MPRVTMNYGDAVGERITGSLNEGRQRKQFPNEQQTERKPANSLKHGVGDGNRTHPRT